MSRVPEVTAVVLSIGEPTTARAIESVKRQTVALKEIVLIEGIAPFHRALNEGVGRVTTPLFVQVDADMILDPDCVESLAACLADNVAVVVGQLRDPLYGRVEGIKLFRTESVRRYPFRDSISPDTDFVREIGQQGWAVIYALRYPEGERAQWHTLGEHDPGYAPRYTYTKHVVKGRRLRYREDGTAVRDHLQVLHASTHPASLIAEIALAHGLFLDCEGDLLGRYQEDGEFRRLMDFLGCRGRGRGRRIDVAPLPALFPKAAFRRWYRLGISLARGRSADRFERELGQLHGRSYSWSWVMQVGLCHGIFAERFDPATLAREWSKLRVFGSCFQLGAATRPFVREVWARVRAPQG